MENYRSLSLSIHSRAVDQYMNIEADGHVRLTLGLFPCPHCTLSDCEIYPSKGRIYVRSDSKVQHPLPVQPISPHFQRWHVRSSASLHQKTSPLRKNLRKVAWTQVYRRMHNKALLRRLPSSALVVPSCTSEVLPVWTWPPSSRRGQTEQVRAMARADAVAKAKEVKKAKEAKKKEKSKVQ